ncbi:MAG TPA: error-prone DNA polymerase [Polyangiaceae bacterium]|nr:error-prone DNA polymerase [Polyangiaceae bacterium]
MIDARASRSGNGFVELLARSCFSFLRGASQPEELIEHAAKLGLGGLGLVDLDGLYGMVRGFRRHLELFPPLAGELFPPSTGELFPPEAGEPAMRYHVGAELSLASSRSARGARERREEFATLTVGLLVQNPRGYANLCRLLSLAHEDRERARACCESAWLAEHSEGLFALLIPPVRPSALDEEDVRELVEVLGSAFEGRVATVIYRHRDGFDREREEWARTWGGRWPFVASARPSYHEPLRKPLADVVHCIRRGLTLEGAGSELDGSGERYLKGPAQMRREFADHPEWLEESERIAATLRFHPKQLNYRFPCRLEPGQSADARLRQLVEEGTRRHFPRGTPEWLSQRIEKELAIIEQVDVAPYFLSTREVIEIARERGILCQGRGSAANSAICYLLDITAIPPESHRLFERFLSPERREPPDIDIDFEHERREEVIQELYRRHGRERAAMVSEVISYRTKSALRDVAKVFGLGVEQIERLSESMTASSDDDERKERALERRGFSLEDPRLRQVVALANRLRGFPRHLSIHVGGFVLSAEPLYAVAPIEAARMKDRTVIPWDKDDIDTLGFYKVDVLGLGMLTAVRKALCSVHAAGGLRREDGFEPLGGPSPLELMKRIPEGDETTYDMVCRADTVGVFQIESRAQMSMLPRLRPREYYDLVIQVAIVRPGPIQGGMVHPYLRRRRGEESSEPPHPLLHDILSRTLGVPLFQEQVMQIAITGAGYTGGEADQLRRDMAAWKKHGRLWDHRERLLEGFAARGIATRFGEALFEQIQGFAEYGFPESHAASFALIVYASSWLKAHYPAHFTCALLNSQPLGFYAPTSLVRDAQKHGVLVHDTCVVESSWDSTLGADGSLRLGLRSIKGLGEQPGRRIEQVRADGPFVSLDDFARRTGLAKDELAALARAGALAVLSGDRRRALWKLEAPRTGGLFERLESQEPEVNLAPLRPVEQLVLDYAQKGLSVSDHPLRYYRRRLSKRGAVRAADLPYLPGGRRVEVAGLVLHRQRPATASGVVFVSLEDETGIVNLILRPDVFDAYEDVVCRSALLLVEGVIERDARVPVPRQGEGVREVAVIHVLAQRIEALASLRRRAEAVGASPSAQNPQGSASGDEQELFARLSRNFH